MFCRSFTGSEGRIMTNKQFQGGVRLTLAQIERALKETPENKELQELKDIFQNMLEDGT